MDDSNQNFTGIKRKCEEQTEVDLSKKPRVMYIQNVAQGSTVFRKFFLFLTYLIKNHRLNFKNEESVFTTIS